MRINKKSILQYMLAASMTLSSINLAAQLKVGEPAPDFSVKTLSGQTVKLGDYKNKKPVYLKFWATWCSYCKAEMPHLQQIQDQYGENLVVLTINIGLNDSVDNIKKLFSKNNYNLPVYFDEKGELVSNYKVIGTPYHVLIDQNGVIHYQTFLTTDELDKQISILAKK